MINAAFRWYQDPTSATLELRLEVWSFVAGLCELPLRLSWELSTGSAAAVIPGLN